MLKMCARKRKSVKCGRIGAGEVLEAAFALEQNVCIRENL